MNISLKELKILIDSHDYIEFIFLYKKTNNKDSYQLMIEIPIPNRQGRREKTGSCRRKKHHYTLSTTVSKEIRLFKDLDTGKRYIESLVPALTKFTVLLNNDKNDKNEENEENEEKQ